MQWYNNNVPNVLLAPFQAYTDERTESFKMPCPVLTSNTTKNTGIFNFDYYRYVHTNEETA